MDLSLKRYACRFDFDIFPRVTLNSRRRRATLGRMQAGRRTVDGGDSS